MRALSIVVTSTFAAGLAIAAQSVAAQGPVGTTGGPRVSFRGCIYYQHAGFEGAQNWIGGGTRRRYVGDGWNDQISSIACNRNCYLIVYEHRDYGGERRAFYPNIQYVGDAWNDRISSMIARCENGKED